MEFMPESAPAVALGFLFTCFLLLVGAVILVHALIVRKHRRAKKILAGIVGALGIYFGILLTFSLRSEEKVLAMHERKYFCEVDCHLVYSVVNVATAGSLGVAPYQKRAEGVYYIITLEVWFDERTIAPHRGNASLKPNDRIVTVVDDHGRLYHVSQTGQSALERTQREAVPLTRPLRPGESYTNDLVFDLAPDINNPRLFIRSASWITCFFIGHENSFLHKDITFRLEPKRRDMSHSPPPSSTSM